MVNPNKKVHLSFTIGPVQAFIAQSRRTRDLWAGSWLLSYLAECALVAAEKADGTSIIPYRESPKEIASEQTVVGGMPNRFELQFQSEDKATDAAALAQQAIQEAWQQIATEVFGSYVSPVLGEGNNTKEIWDRQVKNFWEVSWVVGTLEGEAKTLGTLSAARKNIRNVNAKPEPGTKCSLMGTLQEISGSYGKEQKQFWERLREQAKGLDVKEGERLCAIALIKRLFPYVIETAIPGDICRELKQQQSWPSTAFFSALPWLKRVEQLPQTTVDAYAKTAKVAGWEESERQAAEEAGLSANWANLDGPAWFADAVRQNEPEVEPEKVATLLKKLNAVYGEVGKKPVPYYALLLMDGDSMGKLVASLGSPGKVSRRLDCFAMKVEKIVQRKMGRTIYAGGDDVMVILPAETAFATADALAQCYTESFNGSPQATLSGAIAYAHWKFPMRQVLQTVHHLLDDIAKEQTGRDSLAIGLIQGSGLNAVWSAPWKAIRGEAANGFGKLDEFIDKFGGDSTSKETTAFNASYLYHLREQFSKLFAKPCEMPGSFGNIDIGNNLLTDIANSEYRRRMSKGDLAASPPETTRAQIKPLLALSQRWKRDENEIITDTNSFGFDGWRVARFLKQVKDGKVDGHE